MSAPQDYLAYANAAVGIRHRVRVRTSPLREVTRAGVGSSATNSANFLSVSVSFSAYGDFTGS